LIRIVLTEAAPGVAEGVRSLLVGGEFEIVGYARDGLEAAQMALRLQPDVLVVHEALPGLSGFRAAELVSAATSAVGVVIIVERHTEAILHRAMQAGAREVVAQDALGQRLPQALRDVAALREIHQDPELALVTDPKRMPVSIAVTSSRGGAGKTTVAVNLAVLFAKRFPNQAVLVDFYGQFGDASLALDLPSGDSIAELASFDELDQDLVTTHLTVHAASSLRLLSAPAVIAAAEPDLGRLDIPFMASLIGFLRRSFRFVFFDMPPLVWPNSRYVFSRCQHVLVVTTLFDLAALRNTRALLEVAVASVGDAERVRLIASRATRRGEYTLDDLTTTCGHKVFHELPDDLEAASGALNAGIPVVLESPNSALSRALNGLADKLVSQL